MADITNITRPLPGSGYLNASKAALENLAKAMEREKAWGTDASGRPVVRHQADLDREQRELEEAAEVARLAAPDPREVLRVARRLQQEAEDESVRIPCRLELATALVLRLEQQQQSENAAIEAGAVEHLLSSAAPYFFQ